MVSSFDGVEMYQQPGSVQRGSHAYFPYHSNPAGHWYSSPAAAYHHQIPEGSAGQQYAAGGNVQDEQPFGYQYHYNELQQQDLVRSPDYRSLVFSCQQPPHGHEESQLPPPRSVKVCNGELASPGSAAGGDVTPPQHMTCRANNVRSPYEWMKKSSYQNQPNNPAPQRSPCRQNADKMTFEWMKKFSYRDNPNPGKTRTKDKYRVVYSDHQRLELEKEFHYSRYITIRRKAELAANLGLSERQVKIWFQNRRAKERKQVKKREELLQKEKLEAAAHLQLPQAVHAMQAAAAVVGSRPLAPPPPHGVVM